MSTVIEAIDAGDEVTIAYYESICPDPQDMVPIGIDSATGDPIVGWDKLNDMPLRRCKCGTVCEVPAPCCHPDCMEPPTFDLDGYLNDR